MGNNLSADRILDNLILANPKLLNCKEQIKQAFEITKKCYCNEKKLLLCGNGGSAADCEHIVGELMKGFLSKRPLTSSKLYDAIIALPEGDELIQQLQGSLAAISLCGHPALQSAITNDIGGEFAFAQQVLGLGNAGDVIIGISTSGNSNNVYYAMTVAKAKGMNLIGLSGKGGGKLKGICDVCICVEETETYKIQEFHQPIYHCLCAMLEYEFFNCDS